MTPDDELAEDVPGFDDPVYDDLRGLLADARVTEPVPDDVAARLDAALAGLAPAGSGSAGAAPAPVVPLRRRRTGQRLLVAASVVGVLAVGGIGLSRVFDGSDSLTSANDSAGSSTTAGGSASQPEAVVPGAAAGSGSGSVADSATGLPELTSAAFADGAALVVAEVRRSTADKGAAGSPHTPGPATSPSTGGDTPTAPPAGEDLTSAEARDFSALRALGCTPGPVAGAASYAILLDGEPAVLVVRDAGGKQVAEARSCAGAVLARTVLP